MITCLQENKSRFTLIHDVWTTKGNRYGFIGATVTYINKDWEFVVNHLSIKLVAWHHQGAWLAEPVVTILKKHQLHKKMSLFYISSPFKWSNNNTMAQEMYLQLQALGDIEMTWNPDTMHVKCICHKLALIVGAGLKELGIMGSPPLKVRSSVLGPFPIISSLATIAEEEEYNPEPAEATQDAYESEGTDESDDESDDKEDKDSRPSKEAVNTGQRRKANELHELTLDYVIRKITGSAPWRQKYKAIAMEKGLEVLDLIAGYGIRWNIKYESRSRAYNAREVIDQMLKEEFDLHACKNARSHRSKKPKPGHFKQILFNPNNWSMIKELNDKLEPFAILMKEMEGDGSTGALVLPKYYVLKQTLTHERDECDQSEPLYPMFRKMVEKVETYLNEALGCETLVMATLLHPAFRLAAFEEFFPAHKDRVEKLLTNLFQDRNTAIASQKQAAMKTTNQDQNVNLPSKPKSKMFNLFHSLSAKAENDELTVYLKGGKVFEMDAEDTKSALIWWKEQEGKYPILSSLARDYSACSASSCAAERTFSAAADVCSANRGKLLPRTIEMCVSSQMWLKDDVPIVGGNFETANKIVKNFSLFKEKNRLKFVDPSPDTTPPS
ncbi:hypothetical protein MJO29_012704 [Puccinia striiformis f. sp. tritici]|nr:hypothetical protein MJO29_012704 [Puccinia striiformis f. sp. tritici]